MAVVWLRRTLCVCYISTMGAKPGDIFNGHILGQDNECPPAWIRYKRRWLKTCLIVGTVCAVMVVPYNVWRVGEAHPLGILLDFVTVLIMNGLLFGSLVNLLVTLYPGAPERVAPIRSFTRNQVCPDCGKKVYPYSLDAHPRYCRAR